MHSPWQMSLAEVSSRTTRSEPLTPRVAPKPNNIIPNPLQPTVPPRLINRDSREALPEEGTHSDPQSVWFSRDAPRRPNAYQKLLLNERGRKDVIISARLDSAGEDEMAHNPAGSRQEVSDVEPQTDA